MGDDTFVLGNGIERRDRTLKSGAVKSRYTVTIKSDKLVMNYNEKALAAPVTKAIMDLIKERISGITDVAAPNTLRARATAARAVAAGKAWATKRYSGGKTGALPPNQSDRLFNDSGRFWKGLAAKWVGGDIGGRWIVNFAANRLSPGTLDGKGGGDSAVSAIWQRLISLVPELEDMGKLADSIPVQRAMRQAQEMLMTKVDAAESAGAMGVLRIVQAGVDAVAAMNEFVEDIGATG